MTDVDRGENDEENKVYCHSCHTDDCHTDDCIN